MWRQSARAAIEAIREPTAEMLEKGFGDNPELGIIWTAAITSQDRVAIWETMIDEALK